VRLWDTASFREVSRLRWGIGPIRSVAFAPDGMTAAATAGQKAILWDLDDLRRAPGFRRLRGDLL
jgi:hypothetical protein